jgi:type I restriction enzyme S subunit
MELRAGYKKTEIGVIPADWGVCPLTEISTKITDGEHLTPKRDRYGYYLLSARNVTDGRINVADVDTENNVHFDSARTAI